MLLQVFLLLFAIYVWPIHIDSYTMFVVFVCEVGLIVYFCLFVVLILTGLCICEPIAVHDVQYSEILKKI